MNSLNLFPHVQDLKFNDFEHSNIYEHCIFEHFHMLLDGVKQFSQMHYKGTRLYLLLHGDRSEIYNQTLHHVKLIVVKTC